MFVGRLLARIRNDRVQVEPVRHTVTRLVLPDSSCTPLEKPDSAGAVTASRMRQAHTDLRETLPQVALLVRTSLPAGLENFMRSEWPTLPHQSPGQDNRLQGRQRLFRNWLDAGSPVGQWAAKSIARARLPRSTNVVPVSASIARHRRPRPTRPCTSPFIHSW